MSMEFYNEQFRRAKKPHKCDCCFKTIQIGERYCYQSGKYDGDFFTRAWCRDCSDVCDWYFYSDYNQDEEFSYDDIAESVRMEFCEHCNNWDHDEAGCAENRESDIWHCPVLLKKIRSERLENECE